MNQVNRFIVEFAVEHDTHISRQVTGQDLNHEQVRQWAEKLVEDEDCFVCLLSVQAL